MEDSRAVNTLKGIGPKSEKLFNRVGVYSIGDLMGYYPRTYEEYGKPLPVKELPLDETATAAGVLCLSPKVSRGGGFRF